MRQLTAVVALLFFCSAGNAQNLTERRMSSADIGTVVFMAPEKWTGYESYDDLEAVSVYELSSSKDKIKLRIGAKYLDLDVRADDATLDEQIITRLDGYLTYAIAEYVERPDKYEIRAARFSPRNHGIYARIFDRSPAKGASPFFTHGARILGNRFITFSLNSNDSDMSALKQTLDVVSSVSAKNEWANAPDFFECKVEQLVGFGIVDEEWGAITAKSVKHTFTVRRTRTGDEHSESSEWVFAGPDEENTAAYCDNELIAHGLFVCHGNQDEAFRMDSKTLRFIYVYLGGYHDVPPEVVPDEESPKPQMGIGTCEAK